MTIGDALPWVAFWLSLAAVIITYKILDYKAWRVRNPRFSKGTGE